MPGTVPSLSRARRWRARLPPGRVCSSPGTRNVALLDAGINDLNAGASATGEALYTGTATPLVAYLKQIGFSIGITTILPGHTGRSYDDHAVDAQRGVAAIAVPLFHCSPGLPKLRPWFQSGYLAVDFFFMLSGFVVAHAYNGRLRRGMRFGHFAQVRIVRLYPLYLLGCAIGFSVAASEAFHAHKLWLVRDATWDLPWAILMIPKPAWEIGKNFALNPPAWSLFLEVVVNLVYGYFSCASRISDSDMRCLRNDGLASHSRQIRLRQPELCSYRVYSTALVCVSARYFASSILATGSFAPYQSIFGVALHRIRYRSSRPCQRGVCAVHCSCRIINSIPRL